MAGINLEGRATLVVEKERAQVVSTLKDMLELSRQSAEENAKAREAAGITESLAEPFVRDTGDMVRPEMRPVEMTEPEAPVQEQIQQSEGTEQAPVTSIRPVARPTEPEEDRVLPLFVPDDVQQDTGFMESVETVSSNLGIPSEDLLRAMHFETGGTFSTSIKNPTGSATGLIQIIEPTAKSLGTSTAELAKMTREEQMVYVEKYLTPYKGRMKDFGDIYMAIHLPVAIGKSNDYVIYDNQTLRTRAYKQNKGLDANKDGKVTKGEAVTRASRDTKPKDT